MTRELRGAVSKYAPWTPEEDAYLAEHAHEGAKAIAAALGRTRQAVKVRASGRGISLRQRDAEGRAVHRQGSVIGQRDSWRDGELQEYRKAVLDGDVDAEAVLSTVRTRPEPRHRTHLCAECGVRPTRSWRLTLCSDCEAERIIAAARNPREANDEMIMLRDSLARTVRARQRELARLEAELARLSARIASEPPSRGDHVATLKEAGGRSDPAGPPDAPTRRDGDSTALPPRRARSARGRRGPSDPPPIWTTCGGNPP